VWYQAGISPAVHIMLTVHVPKGTVDVLLAVLTVHVSMSCRVLLAGRAWAAAAACLYSSRKPRGHLTAVAPCGCALSVKTHW
jgi:hypothetical protein